VLVVVAVVDALVVVAAVVVTAAVVVAGLAVEVDVTAAVEVVVAVVADFPLQAAMENSIPATTTGTRRYLASFRFMSLSFEIFFVCNLEQICAQKLLLYLF